MQDRDSSCCFTSRLDDERRLKAEQDKEYEESLAIDFLKRKALEDEIAETSRLEEVRRAREARVPVQHSTAQHSTGSHCRTTPFSGEGKSLLFRRRENGSDI